MKKRVIRILAAVMLALPVCMPARAGILDGITAADAGTTMLPKLLIEYAKAQVELKTVEAKLVLADGAGSTIVKGVVETVANYFGAKKVVEGLEKAAEGESIEKLLEDYARASARVRQLEQMIQQELVNIQRVADAAHQIANGGDILHNLRTTFTALSPYISNSPELIDYVDYVTEMRDLNKAAYTFFYNSLKDPDIELWTAAGELASDLRMFSYYSGRLEDEFAFVATEILNTNDNNLSQADRRKAIIESHKTWSSHLNQMRYILAKRVKEIEEAKQHTKTIELTRAAFVPEVNIGDNILGSPAEIKDLAERIASQESEQIDSLEKTNDKIADYANPILNFISAIIGLIALIFTVVNAAKVQKGETQRQDALFKVWVGAFISILAMQIIRIMFFT